MRTVSTSFVGAGGPRFWFSVTPEAPAPNYAQMLVQFTHSEDTNKLVGPLQEALSARVPGARIDVRTVETGPPTLIPLSIRVLGEDARVLRAEAEKLKAILSSSPLAINVRDDWGNDTLRTRLEVDQDRASLMGVSSRDIAFPSYSSVRGVPIGRNKSKDNSNHSRSYSSRRWRSIWRLSSNSRIQSIR